MTRRLLSAVAIVACLLGGSAHAAVTQHWKLDDNAASTTVVATVGTNGTLEGGDNTSAKTTAGPGGSITAALDFNGTDDAIDISGASISVASGAAFSVSMWVKFDVDPAASGARLLGNSGATTNNSIRVGIVDTQILARINNADLSFTVPALGSTNWHHVLLTKTTGNSFRLFIDGTESSTGALSSANTFSPNRIGRSSAVFSDAKFAQVKIFNSDESANVATLYAEGTGGGASAIPLLMHMRMIHAALTRPRHYVLTVIEP
jgi:hypothetical protein